MKLVINKCYGGFRLSDAAYERLIELGIPVRPYIEQGRDPKTDLYLPEPKNDGEVIFDRSLTPKSRFCDEQHIRVMGRYWDSWTADNRNHELVVRVVEELGEKASSSLSSLKVVEIPDGVEFEIQEYDGIESVHEKHRCFA